jgi:hypothetical protein
MGNLFTFPRAIDPLAGILTPEELQQQEILNGFETGRRQGFVPAMVGALDVMRRVMPAQDASPTPRTFSGGDVIGLMPEQTTALLDRAQRSNEIDQRMYEGRQQEMREEQRVREGRILTARDAEARRKQELAIEQARIDRDAAEERRKRMQPEVSLVPGNPEFSQRKTFNQQTGMPEIEIFKTPGVTLPVEPPKPVLVNTVGPNGENVQMFVTPEVGKTYAEQPTPADEISTADLDRVMDMLNKSDMPEETKVQAYEQFKAGQGLPYIEYRDKDTGFTTVTVTDEKGNQVLKRIKNDDIPESGIVVKGAKTPPKPDPAKAVNILKQAYDKKEVSDAPRKQSMELLAQLGFDPAWVNQFANSQGLKDDNSYWPGSLGEQFMLPVMPETGTTPTSTLPEGVPQGSTPIMYGGKPAWQTPDGKVVLE